MATRIMQRWAALPPRLHALAECLAAAAILGLLTWVGFYLQANQLTISLFFLLVVVAVASFSGFWQASIASVLAVLLLDYYFEPPIFSFEVASPAIFLALATFEVTALAISRLHARELQVEREAAFQRAGMKQLYELSRSTLLLDLRQPPGQQLAILIQRIFDAAAVAVFDANLGRQDRAGDWWAGEEDIAKERYLLNAAKDDPQSQTSERILRAGVESVGALVVRGKLGPVVVDALAALVAIAIDRHRSFESEDRAETSRQSETLRAAVMDALAHEFKTPLTAVLTASSGLLELGGLTKPQAGLVRLIDDEAIRLNELCTRLLKTAKLDPEQVDLKTEDVIVEELVSDVLASQPVSGRGNSVSVVLDDPGLTVQADRSLLEMILKQYIDNAKKYSTPESQIRVEARRSRDEILISVHNFGLPIRIEDRERIFERFYRLPEVKDAIPGTGIGLSVVRKAAEAHHGHVWVISDDQEGTTFFLSLPNTLRRRR
jgi:two-component system sensor histidine kinase KdpD